MATPDKVTVEKSYFDALLRRADFHTSAQLLGRRDPKSVTISRIEYDSLLRTSREFELLKNALFQGGLGPEALATLISGAGDAPPSNDATNAWSDDFDEAPPPSYGQPIESGYQRRASTTAGAAKVDDTSDPRHRQTGLRVPNVQRQTSYGLTSVPDESGFDDSDSSLVDGGVGPGQDAASGAPLRTLYFCGFPGKTTLRDLLSVIRGGRLLSVNMRSPKSATVTFLDAAGDYLAWAKKHDVYIHAKRVDVRWAERQYTLNNHINNKIVNGATRNIVIRSAEQNGLTESQIREDMEHICNFVIIDITFNNGDAFLSSNSVHNALFARTCMMSRRSYKGCKIEFYPDECDVPLPTRTQPKGAAFKAPSAKDAHQANRFDMLNIDGSMSSDDENRDPLESQIGDSDDSDDTVDIKSRHGVRIDLFETDAAR